MVDASSDGLNLQEQIARINQMQTEIARKRQEIPLAPLQLMLTSLISGIAAGAALFAAAVTWGRTLH